MEAKAIASVGQQPACRCPQDSRQRGQAVLLCKVGIPRRAPSHSTQPWVWLDRVKDF